MGFFLLFAWISREHASFPLAGGETALVLCGYQEEGPSGMATLWIELQVKRA